MCWDEDTRNALKTGVAWVGAEKDNLICIKTITNPSQIVRIRSFVLARVRNGRKPNGEDAEAFCVRPNPPTNDSPSPNDEGPPSHSANHPLPLTDFK